MSQKFGTDSIRKVADLARLELSDKETELFTSQINTILTYVEKLQSLNTSNVEPMVNALSEISKELGGQQTRFNNDEVVPGPGAEAMVNTAPDSILENYKVPQVIGGGH